MDKFYELDPDTISDFEEVFNTKSFPINIKIQYVGTSTQKQLIKIAKIADDYSFILKKEIKVSINEELMSVFDEESIKILMEQEIDKITADVNSGKIKMIKPDLNTFSGIVNKYGIDKVSRANQVEDLAVQQKKDDQEVILN